MTDIDTELRDDATFDRMVDERFEPTGTAPDYNVWRRTGRAQVVGIAAHPKPDTCLLYADPAAPIWSVTFSTSDLDLVEAKEGLTLDAALALANGKVDGFIALADLIMVEWLYASWCDSFHGPGTYERTAHGCHTSNDQRAEFRARARRLLK